MTTPSPTALALQQAATITAAAHHTASLMEGQAAALEVATLRLRKAGRDLCCRLDEAALLLAELMSQVAQSATQAQEALDGVLIAEPSAEPQKVLTAPEGTLEGLQHDPEFWPDATREERQRDQTVSHNKALLNGVAVPRIDAFPLVDDAPSDNAPSPAFAAALNKIADQCVTLNDDDRCAEAPTSPLNAESVSVTPAPRRRKKR